VFLVVLCFAVFLFLMFSKFLSSWPPSPSLYRRFFVFPFLLSVLADLVGGVMKFFFACGSVFFFFFWQLVDLGSGVGF